MTDDFDPEHWKKMIRQLLSSLRTQALLGPHPGRCATLLADFQRCNAPITEAESMVVDGRRYCLTCFRRFLRTGVVEARRDEESGETYFVSVR